MNTQVYQVVFSFQEAPLKGCRHFFISVMQATCFVVLALLDFLAQIISDEEHKVII
jgi:hypothetical protein